MSIDAFFPCGNDKWKARELGEPFPDGVISLDLMMLNAQQALWNMFVFNFCHGFMEALLALKAIYSRLAHVCVRFGVPKSKKSKAVTLAVAVLVLLPAVIFGAQMMDQFYDVHCPPGEYEASPNLCSPCSACLDTATCADCKNVTRQPVSSVTVQLGRGATGLRCAPHSLECKHVWAMALCNLLNANANSTVRIQRCPGSIVVLSLSGADQGHSTSRRSLLNAHDVSVVVLWYIRHQEARSGERMSVVNTALAQSNASILGAPVTAITPTTPPSTFAKVLVASAPAKDYFWAQHGRLITCVAAAAAGGVCVALVMARRACCGSVGRDSQQEGRSFTMSSLHPEPPRRSEYAPAVSGSQGKRAPRVSRRERAGSKPGAFDFGDSYRGEDKINLPSR